MEKKGNRNTPNSSRGSSGTDAKKNADVSTSKQGPRAAARRREPPCGFAKTAEFLKKPQPQRNAKASDKRPKPRGFYYSGALHRNEETSLEEFNEAELGSVFFPGSKKQSLNHLLNFSSIPRGSSQPSRTKQTGNWLGTKKHKYNKEHFLQANCQFIVNEKGDYRKYMSDPDVLVDWDLIEQVIVQVNEKPSCPICLYPPVAAKMTKCGHIYCWPCILHYLALSDEDYRRCPICYVAVKKDDLKSVIAIPHQTFKVNDMITFKLMKRQRGVLTAFPIDAQVPSESNIVHFWDVNQDNGFSKLFLASFENILSILDRENLELDVLMSENENCPERCFMDQAKQLLETRKNIVLGSIEHKNQSESISSGTDETSNLSITNSNLSNPLKLTASTAEMESNLPKFHYFYQAEDGQHIYLHAINAKMIEHSYGSLEFGPKTLTGKILEKEGGSMTEDLRKKLRYLQHLPVTCQFEVAEIELGATIISKESLDYFKDQIEIRRKRRKRREKEEKRREKRIEVEENKIIGKYETPELHLDSVDQFPDVNRSHHRFPDYINGRIRTESESTFPSPSERSISPDLLSSLSSMSLENSHAGPSFATMLATEKKPTWPMLKKTKPTNQPSSTPVKLINVTGSNMASGSIKTGENNSDPEIDYEPVPDFNRSFGDALAEALAKGLDDSVEVLNDGPSSLGKRKKKKNKQKLVFSTLMSLPGN